MTGRSRSESISRVLSPCGWRSFLWARDCSRAQATIPEELERAAHPPIWSCSGWGLACVLDYSRTGGLLPRHFTLTLAGGLFSVPLSADRSAPPLTAILPYGARTFLPIKGDRPTHSGSADCSIARRPSRRLPSPKASPPDCMRRYSLAAASSFAGLSK